MRQHTEPSECPFCQQERHVLSNGLAALIWDEYPVNPGHCLIVPLRHVAGLFDLTPGERAAMWELLEEARALVERRHSPSGWNVGVNVGGDAGQTIFHCHLHLIPRYPGDDPRPRGGVRRVKKPLREY